MLLSPGNATQNDYIFRITGIFFGNTQEDAYAGQLSG
jgi:hypothetical protein